MRCNSWEYIYMLYWTHSQRKSRLLSIANENTKRKKTFTKKSKHLEGSFINNFSFPTWLYTITIFNYLSSVSLSTHSLNLNQSNFNLLSKIFFTVKSVNFHWFISEKIFLIVKSVNFHWSSNWNLTDSQ